MQTLTHWTAAALDGARSHGLEAALRALALPAQAQVDDLVELPGRDGPVRFIVRRRCWRAGPDGVLQLLIELDHPPRPGGRG